MPLSLKCLLESILLFTNAVAILNEKRFLAKIGWNHDSSQTFSDSPGIKSQLINLIKSIQMVMRVPLIFLNIVVIILELILG
ncbi:unnamed protein product [Gordionus sp. m RMFG-2023]|uniref:immediate early response 3-interacting protein 1-like isoform X3 n=1 Tax=Gordionus sp. m RMFG-2023 TaxID=3053472 RepID=UPI0030E0A482